MADTGSKQVTSMEELARDAQTGGKAIELRGGQAGSLVIDSDLWRFASGLVQGGMVPKGLNAHAGAVCAIIQAGAEIGFPPMHSLSALTFINGRLGIMGEASRGLVRARGMLKQGTNIEISLALPPDMTREDLPEKLADWPDSIIGRAWCWPKGSTKAVEYTFSVGDAKRAGLWNPVKHESPWYRYPDRMLMNRAWGFLFRDHFSEAFSGLWTTEELRDIDPIAAARDVTPQQASRGPGPGDKDPALALPAEATPEPPTKAPEETPAEPESPTSRHAGPPCTHPDGFAPSSERAERFCIHCGLVAEPTEPDQQELMPDAEDAAM